MKLAFKTVILFLVVSATAAGAAPICTPIAPAEWKQHVDVLHVAGSGAVARFEQNGCDWGGLEQLNGTDGMILDVAGHPGPADVVVTLGDGSLTHNTAEGYFLSADCTRMDGAEFKAVTESDISPKVNPVVIPDTARWLVLNSTIELAVTDVTVTVRSLGRDCPVKKPRKKR